MLDPKLVFYLLLSQIRLRVTYYLTIFSLNPEIVVEVGSLDMWLCNSFVKKDDTVSNANRNSHLLRKNTQKIIALRP